MRRLQVLRLLVTSIEKEITGDDAWFVDMGWESGFQMSLLANDNAWIRWCAGVECK
jgi:hypothetical protein